MDPDAPETNNCPWSGEMAEDDWDEADSSWTLTSTRNMSTFFELKEGDEISVVGLWMAGADEENTVGAPEDMLHCMCDEETDPECVPCEDDEWEPYAVTIMLGESPDGSGAFAGLAAASAALLAALAC